MTTRQPIAWNLSLALSTVLALGSFGCRDATVPTQSIPAAGSRPMISETEAVAKARAAIQGKIIPQVGAPVEVRLQGDDYVVTFVHVNPPGTRGPDYEAQVHLNARTGEVTALLFGS